MLVDRFAVRAGRADRGAMRGADERKTERRNERQPAIERGKHRRRLPAPFFDGA